MKNLINIISKKNSINLSRGFTLIELIVVITIIGILSSVLVANFMQVREKTRDSVRKKDFEQIRLALETYRIDVGSYPAHSSSFLPNCPASGSLRNPTNTSVVYMELIPCDPKSKNQKYTYNRSSTLRYTLSVCLENPNEQLGPTIRSVSTSQCASGKLLEVTNP